MFYEGKLNTSIISSDIVIDKKWSKIKKFSILLTGYLPFFSLKIDGIIFVWIVFVQIVFGEIDFVEIVFVLIIFVQTAFL